MTIVQFAEEFVEALNRQPLPPEVGKEQGFKRRFVIPLADRIAGEQQDILIYTPPFRSKQCCAQPCAAAPPGGKGRVLGCPRCWRRMKKEWGSVAALGTHTFDLMAKDASAETLALEAKLVAPRRGRMPNSEIQRFLGQCVLAATKHSAVIGVCGYRGSLNPDIEAVKKQLGPRVHLVLREVP